MEIPRQQLFLYAAAIVAVALVGARYLKQEGGHAQARAPGPIKVERSSGGFAFVHVTGAVRHPGVYRLPAWARLDLAVKRAGGPARGADIEGVNLAARLEGVAEPGGVCVSSLPRRPELGVRVLDVYQRIAAAR